MMKYTELEEQIRNINPASYAQTRNFLDGDVTKLSPYITRGVVTLPQIRDTVLAEYSTKESYKFIQELAWREYFQRVWEEKGDEIFSDIRFTQDPVDNHEIPASIALAETGINVIDTEIKNLYQDGYIHNHSRMSIASLCCNLGKSHWLVPARWMYYHLFDGDPASNMLSWQWVAGSSISKKYFIDQDLIDYWSKTTQKKTFLSFDRAKTLDQDKPDELMITISPQLSTKLPESEIESVFHDKDICIYHSFSLDPLWRSNDNVTRVLLLEPQWFKKMPVSQKVLDFIITLAKELIPDMYIIAKDFDVFTRDISRLQNMYVVEHPSIVKWDHPRLFKEKKAYLFPEVTGYYKSFFAYWKQCEKYIIT